MEADGQLVSRTSSIELQDQEGPQLLGSLRTLASEELTVVTGLLGLEHKIECGPLKGWMSAEPHCAHLA